MDIAVIYYLCGSIKNYIEGKYIIVHETKRFDELLTGQHFHLADSTCVRKEIYIKIIPDDLWSFNAVNILTGSEQCFDPDIIVERVRVYINVI